ncbi:YceI family protein [Acetobacter sp. AN02]|uniref:YceI family protein n=1 Tax=Acetobacter sp. AN02 TaxID=2894186 RepID=UPI002434657C|nr:YceI family protein [Acetobacter sp. AN02]MDG6094350.1 YceI family protein [Acetobacter sp. AN02]
MKKTVLAALSAAFLSGTAMAAPVPVDVQAGTYKAEPGHTQVVFSVLHMGFTNYTGLFSQASGSLVFSPSAPASAKLSVTIPVSSVQTTSDRLTGELKDKDWLDAAKYPEAKFVSTHVVPGAAGDAVIEGNLTLHGVTKPATLKAHFIGAGTNPMNKAYTIGFEGSMTIRRSEFGVKTYVPLIGDEVELKIAGAFEKQA